MVRATGGFILAVFLVLALRPEAALSSCERQLVRFDNREKWFGDDSVWGVSYDEETHALYIKAWLSKKKSPWKRRGNHILRTNRVGGDYAHFVIPDDQSELDAVNGLGTDVAHPNIANTPQGKFLLFVTGGLHSSKRENSDIRVARLNEATKKWEIRGEDQLMLRYVNTEGLETLPFMTDDGLTLYFTGDANRPCAKGKCACDSGWKYLAGTCFEQYKYVRHSFAEPFKPAADGIQVLDTGRIRFPYLRNVKVGKKFYQEFSGMGALTLSKNGWAFFNGPGFPPKDWDRIYVARWDGTKFVGGKEMRKINDIPGEGIKEKPEVIADGSGLYWSSGRTAISTKLYFLDLTKVQDKEGLSDCTN